MKHYFYLGNKRFAVEFSHGSVDVFTMSRKKLSYSGKMKAIGHNSVKKGLAKVFGLSARQINQAIGTIIDLYLKWHRELKNEKKYRETIESKLHAG